MKTRMPDRDAQHDRDAAERDDTYCRTIDALEPLDAARGRRQSAAAQADWGRGGVPRVSELVADTLMVWSGRERRSRTAAPPHKATPCADQELAAGCPWLP